MSEFKKLLEESANIDRIPKVGDILDGVVVSSSKKEVLISIDGFGSGMVRGREVVDESGEYSNIKNGDSVKATVIDLENELGYVELSFRHAGHKIAWDRLKETLSSNDTVMARIVDANKGGLMVTIGNVRGFLPVSQLTIEHYPRVEGGDKNKILGRLKSYIGQDFKCKIIDIDSADDKLIVSEKAAWDEKQLEKIQDYKVGDIIKGKITGIVDFGAFVELNDGVEGLVHISEIAWQRLDHPKDYVKVGDMAEARIIEIDGTKISLSMKQVKEDPWKSVEKKYKIGEKVSGKVLKVNPFGVFVELDKDIHGLAHVSELDKTKQPVEGIKPGDTMEFTIVSISAIEHRLGLSNKENPGKKEEKPKKDAKKKAETSPASEEKTETKAEETTEEKPKKKAAKKAE